MVGLSRDICGVGIFFSVWFRFFFIIFWGFLKYDIGLIFFVFDFFLEWKVVDECKLELNVSVLLCLLKLLRFWIFLLVLVLLIDLG